GSWARAPCASASLAGRVRAAHQHRPACPVPVGPPDPTGPYPWRLGPLPPSVGRRGAQHPRAPAPAACFDAGKKSLLPSLRPTPSGSEAAFAPCTAGQLLDVYEFCDRDGLDDQLCDAVSAADGMGVGVV